MTTDPPGARCAGQVRVKSAALAHERRRLVPRGGVSIGSLGASSLVWLAVLSLATFAACGRPDSADFAKRDAAVHVDSMGAMPETARVVPLHNRRELVENSGATMSTRQPGVFFTINDSGHEPLLFALDTTGEDRGGWRVTGATNGDWEAISMGPCTTDSTGAGRGERACIYIGDVGDNSAQRSTSAVYRVPEPATFTRGAMQSVTAERFLFRYADRPHDVEAMYVGPQGAVYLITKRPLAGPKRSWRRALVFAWGSRHGAISNRRPRN